MHKKYPGDKFELVQAAKLQLLAKHCFAFPKSPTPAAQGLHGPLLRTVAMLVGLDGVSLCLPFMPGVDRARRGLM